MKYLKDYREGDRVEAIYLCKFKQSAMTKNGKPYETVILQDKTGTLDAKVWNPNDAGIDEFEALDFIQVSGEIVSFQGAYQVNVKRIRRAGEGEYDPGEYLPVSKKDIGQMYEELKKLIESIGNSYCKQLLKKLFIEDKEFAARF